MGAKYTKYGIISSNMAKLKRKLRYILHRLGFHNSKCRRRLFTTKNKYICLITGNTHKKIKL